MDFTFVLKAVAVVGITALLSVFWALYFRFANARRPHMAALADIGIVSISALNVLSYTQDKRLLVPYILGSYIGTWIAVRHRSKEPPKDIPAVTEAVQKWSGPEIEATLLAALIEHERQGRLVIPRTPIQPAE